MGDVRAFQPLDRQADSILDGQDPELCGEDDGTVSGEVRLWRQVIRQAFADLGCQFSDAGGSLTGGRARVGGLDWRKAVRFRREAVAWFTAESEREDFATVCDLAGLDPDFVRSLAAEFIEQNAERYEAEDAIYETVKPSELGKESPVDRPVVAVL